MPKNVVSVFPLERKFKALERAVREAALFSLNEVKQKGIAVEIFLVSDKAMASLNWKYRGKRKPTNVLSFETPYPVPRPDLGNGRFVGEIFLGPDYAKKKKDELEFLVIHGILHLLGYTHESEKKSIIMSILEHKIWNQLCRAVKTQ